VRVRIQVCKCQRHGRILLDEDVQGPEFACKEQAILLFREKETIQIVGEKNADRLVELIFRTSLPFVLEDVKPSFLAAVEFYNRSVKFIGSCDGAATVVSWNYKPPEIIHEVIDEAEDLMEFSFVDDVRARYFRGRTSIAFQ